MENRASGPKDGAGGLAIASQFVEIDCAIIDAHPGHRSRRIGPARAGTSYLPRGKDHTRAGRSWSAAQARLVAHYPARSLPTVADWRRPRFLRCGWTSSHPDSNTLKTLSIHPTLKPQGRYSKITSWLPAGTRTARTR